MMGDRIKGFDVNMPDLIIQVFFLFLRCFLHLMKILLMMDYIKDAGQGYSPHTVLVPGIENPAGGPADCKCNQYPRIFSMDL